MVWLTDITEHPTVEGKLYVCSIKDVFSNRIVGYAIDERMTAQLAVHRVAFRDRSSSARRHRRCSLRQGLAVSRSSVPGCAHANAGCADRWAASPSAGDNAAMESFYSLLQKNVLNRASLADPQRAALRDHLPGSSTPTTAAAVNAALGQTHPRRVRTRLHRQPRPTSQHDQSQPPSTEHAADPFSIVREPPDRHGPLPLSESPAGPRPSVLPKSFGQPRRGSAGQGSAYG